MASLLVTSLHNSLNGLSFKSNIRKTVHLIARPQAESGTVRGRGRIGGWGSDVADRAVVSGVYNAMYMMHSVGSY